MQALRMFGPGDVRVVQVPVPDIGDHEVLVKVKSVGICGTDLRIIRNGITGVGPQTPRTLGHEIGGIIAEVGRSVKNYRKGMRVGIAPNFGCGICDCCIRGDQHLCARYEALGIQMDGGFAEYVRIPEQAVRFGNLVELPETISFDAAAINEPLSCVYNGIIQCPIAVGDDVLIIGAGPIGMMYAQMAKMCGAARVILTNRSPERLAIAKRIDDSFLTAPTEEIREQIGQWTDGRGVDVCVTANASPEAQQLAVELVGLNGKINFFGGLPKASEQVTLNTNAIHYKQLSVTGSTKANNHHFRKTLQFIGSGILKAELLVSAKYAIGQAEEAIQYAMSSLGVKTLIAFD